MEDKENKCEGYYPKRDASTVGLFGRLALSAKNDMAEEKDYWMVSALFHDVKALRLTVGASSQGKFEAKKAKDDAEKTKRLQGQIKSAEELALRISIEENKMYQSRERQRRNERAIEDKLGEAAARRVNSELEAADRAQEKLGEDVARRTYLEEALDFQEVRGRYPRTCKSNSPNRILIFEGGEEAPTGRRGGRT